MRIDAAGALLVGLFFHVVRKTSAAHAPVIRFRRLKEALPLFRAGTRIVLHMLNSGENNTMLQRRLGKKPARPPANLPPFHLTQFSSSGSSSDGELG